MGGHGIEADLGNGHFVFLYPDRFLQQHGEDDVVPPTRMDLR
jgi:hypothetical protein